MSLNGRMDTLWFIHTVEYYIAVKKELTLVTWSNMDKFCFFEKKKPDAKEYGLYDCTYVKFKNRSNAFIMVEIRIVITFCRGY